MDKDKYFTNHTETMLNMLETIKQHVIRGRCTLSMEPLLLEDIEATVAPDSYNNPRSFLHKQEYKINFELNYKYESRSYIKQQEDPVSLLLKGFKV
jgi:hypothetical protein